MANISLLSRLVNGVQRQVDLSSNTLVVLNLLMNGISLSSSATGVAGSTAIGDDDSYSHFTPTAATVKGALSGIDAALAASGSGSVTSVSVVSTNGFAGTVATPTTTPAITLETTITAAVLAGNGTALTAASLADNEIWIGSSGNLPVAQTLSGDATLVASGALTLATVNTNVGSFGSSTSIPSFTVNAKGLITAASGNAVIAPAGTLSGTTLNSTVTGSSLTSLGTQAQALNMGGFQINNVAAPSVSTDAATKGYVDSAINGLTWKGPVSAYSNTNVALTGGATLTIDGYAVQNGNYVILANQTTASQNYVYVASGIGTAYTLTEVTNSEAPTAVGDAYLIEKGTAFGNTAFQVNAISPNVTFIQFAGPNTYTFSSPLALAGNVVSLNYSNGLTLSGSALVVENADSSITVAAGGISVNLNAAGAIINSSGLEIQLAATNPGLAITSNHLDVKYNPAGAIVASASGIASQVLSTGGIQISSNSLALLLVASTALATSSSGLAWQFDNTTIGVNGSNQAYVKNAGISATQLATGAFDQVTIVGGAGTPASVASAPSVTFAGVAGQTFAANTTYALRYGISSNGETAGRLYAADYAPGSPVTDRFWVVGFLASGAGASAGGAITVIKVGVLTLGSSDTAFASTDSGTPVFLQGSGSFLPASTATLTTSGNANAKIGMVISTSTFLADIGAPYVY